MKHMDDNKKTKFFNTKLIQGGGSTFGGALRNTNNNNMILDVGGNAIVLPDDPATFNQIQDILLELERVNWTMGKGFHGVVNSGVDGKTFDENSIVLTIGDEKKFSEVVDLAKTICEKFNQVCVLVKDHENNQIYSVGKETSTTEEKEEEEEMELSPYKVTYEVVGTVTLSVLATSPETALDEAEKEYPESDINWNHMLRVLDMQAVAVEDKNGNVTEF